MTKSDLLNFNFLNLTNSNLLWRPRKEVGVGSASSLVASFGLEEIDLSLSTQGLPLGKVSEWFLAQQLCCRKKNIWYAPLTPLMAFLSRQLYLQRQAKQILNTSSALSPPSSLSPGAPAEISGKIVWVGKKLKPTPFLLNLAFAHAREQSWFWEKQCVFIDIQDREERLWSAIQFLGLKNLVALLVDVSSFNLKAMRRLQLATEKHSALCLAIRPPWEADCISAAHSKWVFTPSAKLKKQQTNKEQAIEESGQETWELELIKSKNSTFPKSWKLSCEISNPLKPFSISS